jgi:hypothetical protein
VSISGDLGGQESDEGSFRGNRQNVFERGVAHAERVVLAPSPANGPALKINAANGDDMPRPNLTNKDSTPIVEVLMISLTDRSRIGVSPPLITPKEDE